MTSRHRTARKRAATRLTPRAECAPYRTGTRVGSPSECENIVDQIATTLRRPAYLVDMLCRFGSACELRLNHFRIAENGANDVVEVMRDSACKRSDHLHATRPLQPHREFRPVALKKFALERIGYRVPGKPHDRHRLDFVPYRPEGVKTHDASDPSRSGQRHAGPGTHTGGCQRVLGWARRQGRASGTVTMSGSATPSCSRQCQRLIGPARRECFSVPGPCVYPDGVFIQHHIGAIRADRPAELAQHLL